MQPVEREARIVEHARQRDGDVGRVERGGAAALVGVHAAPQIFDARNAGARVIRAVSPGGGSLRGDADALQVAREAVALDRLRAGPMTVAARLAGFRLAALDFDQVVGDEPARVIAHEAVQERTRQRQRAAELRENARVDAIARHADELPVLLRSRPVVLVQRLERERARERRAVFERRLAEFGAHVVQLQLRNRLAALAGASRNSRSATASFGCVARTRSATSAPAICPLCRSRAGRRRNRPRSRCRCGLQTSRSGT